MYEFIKFVFTCIWNIGGPIAPDGAPSNTLFIILGTIGLAFFSLSFLLFSWFVVKFESLGLRIAVSLLISLFVSLLYFSIAYCFVR